MKKKRWLFWLWLIIGIIAVVGISFASYVLSTGSKIFEKGFGSGQILKTIYGKETLQGQKDDRINLLLLGMGGFEHSGGLLSDTIMVLSIKPSTNEVAMFSIPRDLNISIPGNGEGKINSVTTIGYNDYSAKNCTKKSKPASCVNDALLAGAKLQAETVSKILDIPIPYYLLVDFQGFEKIIDQLGGVDVQVAQNIYDREYPDAAGKGYEPFSIKAGNQHLDGKTALKYARSRHGTAGGDFDRAARQQQIVAAAKEKALKNGLLSNPKKLMDMVNIVSDSLRTNLTPAELRSLVDEAKDVSTAAIKSKVFSTEKDGRLSSANNGSYILKPTAGNYSEMQKDVKFIFSSTVPEAANLEVLNGTGVQGQAATLAKLLSKNYSYNVPKIATTTAPVSNTVIYDYTGGKMKDTVETLRKLLNCSAQQKTSTSATAGIDISIVLGSDYKKVE